MKLFEASSLARSAKAAVGEPVVIQLATGFTPLSLQTFVTAFIHQRMPARPVKVRTGHYGDLAGTLRGFHEEDAYGVACVVEWEDLDPRLGLRSAVPLGINDLDDVVSETRVSALRLAPLLASLRDRRPVSLVLPTLQLPPFFPTPTGQLSVWEIELQQVCLELARTSAQARVRVMSPINDGAAAGELAVQSEVSFGFPYTTEHAASVARALADGVIREQPRRKGLVLDLDNTLWRGVVGDDGIDAVSWSLADGSHEHAMLQRAAEFWSSVGVFVGVASKNDPDVAVEALGRRDMVVRQESLFPVEASWGEKSVAVSRILRIWNVAADSVVFIDDSALEIAEVSASHPSIESVQFPVGDPAAVWRVVHRLRPLFGSEELQAEDSLRGASIRAAAQVASALENDDSGSDAFLSSLNGEIVLARGASVRRTRAVELINKTNQFNLNGARFSESELSTLEAAGSVLVSVSYSDRLSRLGDIAALIVRAESGRLVISSWVMSCRAFSRRIEHATLQALCDEFACHCIEFAHVSTPRNGPTQQFLSALPLRETAPPMADAIELKAMMPAYLPSMRWHKRTEADEPFTTTDPMD